MQKYPPFVFSPTVEIQPPTPRKQQNEIAPNEGCKDTQISPPIPIRIAKRLIELISDLVSTVLTGFCAGIVGDIAGAPSGEESRHVVAACLTHGRDDGVQFAWRASHWALMEFRHHLYNYVSETKVEVDRCHIPCLQSSW